MSYRIAWYKLYYPLEFYATFYSIKGDGFDLDMAFGDIEQLKERIYNLKRERKLDAKKKNELMVLETTLEYRLLGYKFDMIDLEKSHYQYFLPNKNTNSIIIALNKVKGLGVKVAMKIYRHKKNGGKFKTKEDLKKCGINKTLIKKLTEYNVLNLEETKSKQRSLF